MMKLSVKINFILLPVMLIIFSIGGIFSYNSQKAQILSSLSDKIKYELKYISEDLNEAIHEFNLLSKIFLSSPSTQSYLNSIRFGNNNHYANQNLTRGIRQIELRHGYITSFGLIDANKQELFLYDVLNPFSSIEVSKSLNTHLSYINKSIQTQGVTQINPVIYEHRTTADGFDELTLIRTFSPDQPISITSFSQGHTIYTAIITIRLKHKGAYLRVLQTVFDDNVKLSLLSSGSSQTMEGETELTMLPKPDYGYQLVSELWSIMILLPRSYLNTLYRPHQILFFSIVLSVTLFSFFFLKGLIVKSIITPVVRLTKQVESTEIGGKINIERAQANDEVAVLSNKYLDLIMELDDLVKHDHLTGLINRNKFNKALKYLIKDGIEHHKKIAVLYFDLDNFKHVNDRFGHYIGDELLKAFSVRVNEYLAYRAEGFNINNNVIFARMSGDEFTIILPDITDIKEVEIVTKNLISLFDDGFKLDEMVFDIGISIGAAIFPNDAIDVPSILKKADIAMYSAKRFRQSYVQFYTSKLSYQIERQGRITESLKTALRRNEFYLVYMPIYDCSTGLVDGCEVLLRVSSKDLAAYGPEEFIPVAEQSGLIKGIDYWVIESAIKQLSIWRKQLDFVGVFAINFSSWELKNPDFVDKVASLLAFYDVPAHCIELEITETCFVPDDHRSIAMLSKLHNLGVRLSLDDFGTGFTAFSQLIDYPLDTLKVDRMFINAIDSGESEDKPLVDIIVEIAKLYNLNVVAEGIETKAQLTHVRDLGCHQAQGFLLSKPLTKNDFVALWTSEKQVIESPLTGIECGQTE
ncbi:putative bifunctional diguanylate cyclase/phosphodiesterase [Moritella marina]|nr:bifunctional diguanylate cyclase/phosphodiesterase [Moritella marina]